MRSRSAHRSLFRSPKSKRPSAKACAIFRASPYSREASPSARQISDTRNSDDIRGVCREGDETQARRLRHRPDGMRDLAGETPPPCIGFPQPVLHRGKLQVHGDQRHGDAVPRLRTAAAGKQHEAAQLRQKAPQRYERRRQRRPHREGGLRVMEMEGVARRRAATPVRRRRRRADRRARWWPGPAGCRWSPSSPAARLAGCPSSPACPSVR